MTGHLRNRVIELIVLQAGSYAQRGRRVQKRHKKESYIWF